MSKTKRPKKLPLFKSLLVSERIQFWIQWQQTSLDNTYRYWRDARSVDSLEHAGHIFRNRQPNIKYRVVRRTITEEVVS